MHARSSRYGLFYGIASYAMSGFIPFYFKSLAHVQPTVVLAHRAFWSFVMLVLVVAALGRWRDVRRELRKPKIVALLTASTLLLAATWLVFIYAIASGQLVEATLGYFFCPLLTVLLGVLLLRERLRPWQTVSIAVALLGVAALTAMVGRLPWIAVTLAATYALYCLVRKIVGMDALLSLSVETLLLAPAALAYLACVAPARTSGGGWATLGLLMLAGPATTVPLLLFGAAARRLSLSTLGMLQYLSTTLQFLVATVCFHEPFAGVQIVSFGLVWTAILLYTADSLHAARQSPRGAVGPTGADL